MAVERRPGGTSLIDVLDRVLDKGLVIDAEVHIAVAGIELVTVNALVKIASFETWDRYTAPERQRQRERRLPRPEPAAPALSRLRRVRLQCEDGCTFERRASSLLVRGGRFEHQRCAVIRGVRCAVRLV